MTFPLEILRSGVALANSMTKGVQGTVTLYQFQSQDGRGKRTYATGVPVHCVIELTRKQKSTGAGLVITVIATLTIMETVPSEGTTGRQEPIDPRDKIVLPDGRTGPIVSVPGAVLDPGTGFGLNQTIELGEL